MTTYKLHFALINPNRDLAGNAPPIQAVNVYPETFIVDLQKDIKAKMEYKLKNTDPVEIKIWKLSAPLYIGLTRSERQIYRDKIASLQFPDPESDAALEGNGSVQILSPGYQIKDYWLALETLIQAKHVHMIVSAPFRDDTDIPQGTLILHPAVSPAQLGSIQRYRFDDLVQLRQKYVRTFPTKSKPPSELAQPSKIPKYLLDAFHYSRPPSATPTVPQTLLHPIFNEFIDNCENYKTSAKDHSFVRDLADEMSRFYPEEQSRVEEFIEICQCYGLQFTPREIVGTKIITDCEMRCQSCIYCLGKVKLEIGAGDAEPVFQAACYYTAHLQQCQNLLMFDSPLPCLGFYLAGSTLGFFGLAFTDRTNIQILNQPIRFDYHYTDVKQRRTAARYMAAFRHAVEQLKVYYDTELPALGLGQPRTKRDPRFPCYSHYTSLTDGTVCEIEYISQPQPDKLIFLGKSGDSVLCVKFVTRYSKEAHLFCASSGVAPALYGFEKLPGGWFMVVMERIGEEYEILADIQRATCSKFHEHFRKNLTALHDEGYVHGDIRDINVMVKADGEEGFLLLDFDWSGLTGKTFYPMNVNKSSELWRPEDVSDEVEILVEHDNAMADRMLAEYRFTNVVMRYEEVP